MSQARMDLSAMITSWHTAYDDELTDAELIAVISGILGDELGAVVKSMIRAERHPEDFSRPGGLE
jgi:hypothetical protein